MESDMNVHWNNEGGEGAKQKHCLLFLDSRLLLGICISGLVRKKREVIKFITMEMLV